MRKSGTSFDYVRAIVRASLPVGLVALASGMAYGQQAPDKLIDTYCSKCHNSEDWAGGVAFDALDLAHAGRDAEIWEGAIERLRGRLMPPAGEKQPPQAEEHAI